MFGKVPGLKLDLSKCILIPSSVLVGEHNVEAISRWISREIPQWAHFKISGEGKHLGIYLGPAAGGMQWAAPATQISCWILRFCKLFVIML